MRISPFRKEKFKYLKEYSDDYNANIMISWWKEKIKRNIIAHVLKDFFTLIHLWIYIRVFVFLGPGPGPVIPNLYLLSSTFQFVFTGSRPSIHIYQPWLIRIGNNKIHRLHMLFLFLRSNCFVSNGIVDKKWNKGLCKQKTD